MIESPRDLVDHLVGIFPAFVHEWDEGEAFGYSGGDSFHAVFLTFVPKCHEFLERATPNQTKEFCRLINHLVERGGDLCNAISTCFLEHASQIGIGKTLWSHLSKAARREVH